MSPFILGLILCIKFLKSKQPKWCHDTINLKIAPWLLCRQLLDLVLCFILFILLTCLSVCRSMSFSMSVCMYWHVYLTSLKRRDMSPYVLFIVGQCVLSGLKYPPLYSVIDYLFNAPYPYISFNHTLHWFSGKLIRTSFMPHLSRWKPCGHCRSCNFAWLSILYVSTNKNNDS